MRRLFFTFLVLCSFAHLCSAADYRSKATGNWSATTTWETCVANVCDGVDAGPPGDGDSALIAAAHTVTMTSSATVGLSAARLSGDLTGTINAHNNVSTIVGTLTLFLTEYKVGDVFAINGAAFRGIVTAIASNTSLTLNKPWTNSGGQAPQKGEMGISIDGTLVVNDGVTLTARGHITVQGGGTLTVKAGGTLTADSATNFYSLWLGQSGLLNVGEATGNRATLTSTTAGNFNLARENSGNTAATQGDATVQRTDISNWGSATVASFEFSLGATSNLTFLRNIFDNNGQVSFLSVIAGADVIWNYNWIRTAVLSTPTSFCLEWAGAATGTRDFRYNVFDAGTGSFRAGTTLTGANFSGSLIGITSWLSGTTITWDGVLLYHRITDAGGEGFGVINLTSTTLSGTYVMWDAPTTNPHWIDGATGQVRDGWVFDLTSNGASGDFSNLATGHVVKNSINLPSSTGHQIGGLNPINGTATTTLTFEHNTWFTRVARGGFFPGEGSRQHPGALPAFRNNIFWSDIAATTSFAIEDIATNLYQKTTTSSTSNTVTPTVGGMPTVLSGLTGWTVRITGGSATPVGEKHIVATNTATVITITDTWSVDPDGTTTFDIYPVDLAVITTIRNNAHIGQATGTIRDGDNLNPTSIVGYNAIYASDLAQIGVNDLVDIPVQFVDATRNLATWPSASLGYSGSSVDSLNTARGNWSGTPSPAYSIGDVVAHASSGFYANGTVLFRAIADHNPPDVANDEPGVGSAWRTYWEMYAIDLIRHNILQTTGYVVGATTANLLTWVKAGFAPRNSAYQAATDAVSPSNGWIGAVEGTAGAGSDKGFFRMRR